MPIVTSIAGQVLDDVYLIETSSSSETITGVSTDIIGLVGVFQQGIPTAHYTIGDYATAVKKLGKSLSTIGGPIAIQNLIRQSAGDLRVVPCFGVGAAVASVTLHDNQSTPGVFGTLQAAQIHPQLATMAELYGSGPNSWAAKVTVNTGGTFNLSIVSASITENYTNLTYANWAATINAASAIVIASELATPNTNPPAVGNFSFTGGSLGIVTSGAALDAALIGDTNEDGTKTGLALLEGVTVNFIMAAEYSSTALNAELAAFAENYQCIAVICAPQADSTADSVISAIGSISQDNVAFLDGWTTCYDADIASNRVCAPTALEAGMAATLAPQKSWGNKSIYGTQGLVNSRSRSELVLLQQANILALSGSIPRGGFGSRSGIATDGSDLYVRRMRNYLEVSIMNAMGWAVDELQSTSSTDTLRSDVKQTINTFLNGLANPADASAKVIDSFLVVCDLTNNPTDQIAAGKLSVAVKVKLLAAAKFIIIYADISTSTITTSSVAA